MGCWRMVGKDGDRYRSRDRNRAAQFKNRPIRPRSQQEVCPDLGNFSEKNVRVAATRRCRSRNSFRSGQVGGIGELAWASLAKRFIVSADELAMVVGWSVNLAGPRATLPPDRRFGLPTSLSNER
ncbi:MAG: hypothetical protein EA381_07890 [Planctomycetaceae bacterium]|nr:MAG: hypothetical protein EA381_07890 [Planctomycetaceae bacterium]